MPDSGVSVLGLTRRGTPSRKRAAWPGCGVVGGGQPAALLRPDRAEGPSGRPGNVRGTRLISEACSLRTNSNNGRIRRKKRVATGSHSASHVALRTHLRHGLGGRPSSSRPGHFPSTTHRRGVFAYCPRHRSPAIRNPPSNNRCRQTFFPPVPGRDALFQFPQNLEVVMKNVTKGLQNRVGKKCYTVLGDAALRPRADDPQPPSPQPPSPQPPPPQPRAGGTHKRRKPAACP